MYDAAPQPQPGSDRGRLAPELRLLAGLASRADAGRTPRPAELALLAERERRERFFGLARRHRVLGLILLALERPIPGVPPDARDHARALLPPLGRRATVWDLERDRVLALLARENLFPLVLKGGALRESLYRDEPVARSLADIDVLLPPEAIDPAVRVLDAGGYEAPAPHVVEAYRRRHFHIAMTRRGGFQVELHWALTRPDAWFRLDPQDFLRRSTVRDRAGRPPLRSPSPEDMILHIAAQTIEGAYSRLFRLVDLDRLLALRPDLDWNYLDAAARRGGLTIVLAFALRLAAATLGTRVPDALARRVAPSPITRLHLGLSRPVHTLLSRGTRARPAAARYLRFWSIAEWRSRARFLARAVTDDRPSLVQVADAEPEPANTERPGDARRRLRRAILGRLRGGAAVAALLAHHVERYAAAAAALLTPGGRRGLRF